MTFLNPIALIGLVAATIPIILHLLNLRKLRTVEFSSLRFLKELQKTKMRRVKIQQILLLIVRTLLVAALVFTFSRPTVKGSIGGIPLGEKARAKSTIVLLLDDSPSMSTRNERGALFAQAKDAAARILDLAAEGDEVRVVRISEVRNQHGPIGGEAQYHQVPSVQAIKSALPAMGISQETTPFRDAFGVAAKVLAESKNFNQEVYLLTDGQATQFTSHGSPVDTTDLFDQRVRIFLLRVSLQNTDNCAVVAADMKSQIITQNRPVTVQALVRNFGHNALQNTLLNVYLSGSRVQQHSLNIPAQGSASVVLSVIPTRSGIQEGHVQLEDDLLEIDNARYFVFTVPENIAVLMVGDTPQDTQFPALALAPGSDTSFAALYSVRRILARDLSSTDINKYDVLALCGIQGFSATEADRITQYVSAGNGLLVFPGKATDTTVYNQILFSRLGIPPMRGVVGGPSGNGQTSFLSFGAIDFTHPLFTGLFEQQVAGKQRVPLVESPHVYKAVTPDAGQHGHAIITLGNGAPFLTEYPVSSGRVLLFSVEAGLSWSDFPVKGLFAPLLHRAALYLGARSESQLAFTVGDELKLRTHMRSSADRGSYSLRVPSGIDERITPRFVSTAGMAQFETPHASEAGIYELRRTAEESAVGQPNKGELVQAVAVNVDPAESDLRPATEDELSAFWSRVGIGGGQTIILESVDKIDATILETRFGVELWKYCVGLALVLAFLEMVIARAAKPQDQHQP
jgi:hypothetical protein